MKLQSVHEKCIVSKHFPERSDQFILLLATREYLYLKFPSVPRNLSDLYACFSELFIYAVFVTSVFRYV